MCSIFSTWTAKRGRIDDDLPDVNSERPWKIESFNSDDHFHTPRVDEFDTFDYDFKERRYFSSCIEVCLRNSLGLCIIHFTIAEPQQDLAQDFRLQVRIVCVILLLMR
jgi:hypothetical protein